MRRLLKETDWRKKKTVGKKERILKRKTCHGLEGWKEGHRSKAGGGHSKRGIRNKERPESKI